MNDADAGSWPEKLYRQPLRRFRYGQGLSREKIADVLGTPEPVVKSRLFEGVTKLREHTSRLEDR